jgi:hypothetical protein
MIIVVPSCLKDADGARTCSDKFSDAGYLQTGGREEAVSEALDERKIGC